MAQKTVVTVVRDLPHEGEIEGTELVSFGFDGNAYEIDLCETHSKELREKVGAFAVTLGALPERPVAVRLQWSRPLLKRSSEIRDWAGQSGHKVSECGRIPATIIADYEAAH